MCGITGFAGTGTPEQLRTAREALIRRGPDDAGEYISNGVGFGFRRLSIIDVEGGHQPISNEDGTIWVMLNGEIYNFQPLRDKLLIAGHIFNTRSDTETIVHAYEEWGDSCFEYLDGMFAIAIWDGKQKRLVLARDRMGKKPLYWTVKNNTLWFASELKALIAADVLQKEINPTALIAYLETDSVPTPSSIFKNTFKLPPASALAWKNGELEKQWSFWKCYDENSSEKSTEFVLKELQTIIDRAVKKRLISDVPLGLFLSGGLDSSLVAESAARQHGAGLPAFTIGFEDASYDERGSARAIADAFGIKLHEEVLTAESCLQTLDECAELLDEPLSDPAILPQLLLAKFTRQHVTVALTGDGGDELLLGYQHIPLHRILNRMPTAVFPLLKPAAWALSQIPSSVRYFSPGFKSQRFARGVTESDPWKRDQAWRGGFDKPTTKKIVRPEIFEQSNFQDPLSKYANEAGGTFAHAWSWAYLRTYLMDTVLVKVDRATMHHSLEARSPLLDTEVVTFLLGLPEKYKTGAFGKKKLFQELLHGKVSNNILDRPKHGFAVPVASWLTGPLKPMLNDLLATDRISRQGIFDPVSLQKLIKDHSQGRDRRKELWTLLMFQRWYDRWMVS